jgi:hypothetical protein
VTGVQGVTGPSGGGSSVSEQYTVVSGLATGYVAFKAFGTSADVAAISVTKTGNSVTISNVTGTAKLSSVMIWYAAADITAGAASCTYPDPTGATTVDTTYVPSVSKVSAAGAITAGTVSAANSTGTVTLSFASLTSSAINGIKLIF